MLKRLAFSVVIMAAPLIGAAQQVHQLPHVEYVPVPAAPTVVEQVQAPYASLIHEYAEQFDIEPKLIVSVIRAESNFNPRAVSPVGARGLMQLMPDTAKQLGVRDSFNPRENIRGGTQHLAYLLERYSGNVHLAVAAYNAGEAAVDKYRGVPPYDETRAYVRVVLAGLN